MGTRFSAPVQTGPGAHPASCTMGTGCFPGVKSGRDVTLTPHPLLVPWSRKGRVIPLLALWAVRPVQSLIACTRVHFTNSATCDFHLCFSILCLFIYSCLFALFYCTHFTFQLGLVMTNTLMSASQLFITHLSTLKFVGSPEVAVVSVPLLFRIQNTSGLHLVTEADCRE